MNKIKKDELFGNLKDFLKSKGIELQQGSYADHIRTGCGLLADSVNMSQDAVHRAKEAVDKGFNQLREVIHQKTAPRPARRPAKSEPAAPAAAPAPKGSAKDASQPKSHSSRKPRAKRRQGKK